MAYFKGTHGSPLTFNINDGYLEAIVRGFRSGILTTNDYHNLTQCDTLEGKAKVCLYSRIF